MHELALYTCIFIHEENSNYTYINIYFNTEVLSQYSHSGNMQWKLMVENTLQ